MRPLRKCSSSGAKIRAVATDMSAAYIAAVQKNLPHARLVFDRFHIVKLMNEKLTELRRQLYREAEGPLGKSVLKGIRWLLLMNPDKLDDAKSEPARLQEALDLNRPLAIAYYLKEDLRQFWEQHSYQAASRFLTRWCARAEASGIRLLQTFAKTLRSPPAPWKGSTTRSNSCNAAPTATETWNCSSCESSHSIPHALNSSVNGYTPICRMIVESHIRLLLYFGSGLR